MKLIKLTALTSLLFALVLGITSCEKNAEKKKTTDYEKKDIVMSGAQETPATPTTALGTMDVFYTKETRILTYTVRWSGLTGSVAAMHIHGLAPTGFLAPTISNTTCGTYTGTLLADGVVVKEDDLLNGVYYINIHTAAYPNGEIRGQIRFQ